MPRGAPCRNSQAQPPRRSRVSISQVNDAIRTRESFLYIKDGAVSAAWVESTDYAVHPPAVVLRMSDGRIVDSELRYLYTQT